MPVLIRLCQWQGLLRRGGPPRHGRLQIGSGQRWSGQRWARALSGGGAGSAGPGGSGAACGGRRVRLNAGAQAGERDAARAGKRKARRRKASSGFRDPGRGERIRTSGLYVPNVALYQAKLHPEKMRHPVAPVVARPEDIVDASGRMTSASLTCCG